MCDTCREIIASLPENAIEILESEREALEAIAAKLGASMHGVIFNYLPNENKTDKEKYYTSTLPDHINMTALAMAVGYLTVNKHHDALMAHEITGSFTQAVHIGWAKGHIDQENKTLN